jgi:hypothetical protein
MFTNGSTARDLSPAFFAAAGGAAYASEIDSIANRRSRADWKRSVDSFSRQRRTRRATEGGVPDRSARSIGCSRSTALIISAGDAPWNARCPVTIS